MNHGSTSLIPKLTFNINSENVDNFEPTPTANQNNTEITSTKNITTGPQKASQLNGYLIPKIKLDLDLQNIKRSPPDHDCFTKDAGSLINCF